MPPFVVGSGFSVMLSVDGLYVFSLPRSIFDALPGLETERHDDATDHRFWTKDAVLLDCMAVCFFCNEPPLTPCRQQHSASSTLSQREREISPTRSDNQTKIQTLGAGVRAID